MCASNFFKCSHFIYFFRIFISIEYCVILPPHPSDDNLCISWNFCEHKFGRMKYYSLCILVLRDSMCNYDLLLEGQSKYCKPLCIEILETILALRAHSILLNMHNPLHNEPKIIFNNPFQSQPSLQPFIRTMSLWIFHILKLRGIFQIRRFYEFSN